MVKGQRTRGWWMDAKIYELYVDKFAGDFKGLTAKLDYFTYLGINTLHILPHYPSPMVDDGYDISDYRGVRSELGTLQDFVAFTDKAHENGIKIITDLVINHVSNEHPWFREARSSRENIKREYFLWSRTGSELKGAPNLFPDFKSSNWIWNDATQDYYYATFYPEQPDLNWDNPKVLEEVLHVMDFWVARGADGFRLDAAAHLVEREGTSSIGLPETHQVLKTLRAHLDARWGKRVVLLAEIETPIAETKSYFGDGDECHLVYHFPLMREMWLALMHRDKGRVEAMVRNSSDTPETCAWAIFLRNHDEVNLNYLPDEVRRELLDFLDPERRYPFNKGKTASVRLGTIFADKPERLLEAFEQLYSLPGVPVMYYGDEIGMQNLPVQKEIVDTRRYVRGNFDWQKVEIMRADAVSLLNQVARCIKARAITTPR